jgi:ribosome-binding factor A
MEGDFRDSPDVAIIEDVMRPRRNHPQKQADDRKTLQLCRQVERALTWALGESEDELLRELLVVSVEPAPNSRRLLVSVAPLERLNDLFDVIRRLDAARGWLRSEVAAAITRRKAPELMFRCIEPPDACLACQ